MEDKIVTLDTFMNFMQAEIALGKLQTAGISCFIDENGANIYPLQTDALGAYKIKVFERDFEKCREILAQSDEAE
ncbi:putative signal transducing protein [Mucilaginibacter panaciglaebae]|uniref:DUF2007 domain-containing protein n=1 Tax=Mucilaginibacter panaciglaebae TaxID=502331 RepID=A0ABP7WC41_9SPHI